MLKPITNYDDLVIFASKFLAHEFVAASFQIRHIFSIFFLFPNSAFCIALAPPVLTNGRIEPFPFAFLALPYLSCVSIHASYAMASQK
jgi:hypothetical protein